jgi:hypothetical protein
MAPLPTEAPHFGNRHTLDADLADSRADFVQFEWLNNGCNHLHKTHPSRLL